MLAILAVTSLTACSLHPIPDDVSPIPTEAIVAAARCELRLGLVEEVEVWFKDENPRVIGFDPNTIAQHLDAMKARYPKVKIKGDWDEYMDIAIAYDWTFDITETHHADAGIGFKLPFVNPGSLDASAGASVTTTRAGKRTFKNQDKVSKLLTDDWYNFCNDIGRSSDSVDNRPVPRDKNFLYPMTGSIGLRKAVRSFLKIAVQEGALDTFTDELAFTTTFNASAGVGVTLSPVSKQFRLVSGSANIAGSRVDLHRVKISLAFPKARPTQVSKKQMAADYAKSLDVRGGYHLNPNWRATYALCVVDGRSREEELKNLRLAPPEVTCLDSTDAFFPRGDGTNSALLTGSRKDLSDQKKGDEREKQRAPAPGDVTPLAPRTQSPTR